MKKQRLITKLLLLTVIIAVAFSIVVSCSKSEAAQDGGYYDKESYNNSLPQIGGSANGSTQDTANGGIGNLPSDGIDNPNAKVIKKATASITTINYDELIEKLYAKIEELAGYTDSDSFSGSAPYRSANITARIPADKLDEFKTTLSELGTLTSYNATKVDVTLAYSNLKARIDTLKLQAEAVENLFELAEKEGDLTKISSLQKELFDIRLELAEAESSLLVYDNSISYSTVTIRVSETKEYIPEPVEERGFFGKIYDGLKKNIGYIFDDIESFTIWFITNIPYFIINAILITIAVFVFIKLRKLYKKINLTYLKKYK